jgi:hypothetical protein
LSAAASSIPSPPIRTERSLLEETLLLVRSIAQEQTDVRALLSQVARSEPAGPLYGRRRG